MQMENKCLLSLVNVVKAINRVFPKWEADCALMSKKKEH